MPVVPGYRPQIAVIGAGPAGLMAAETLCAGGAAVSVFDRMPSVGRKFLLAGRGGLNLTHDEPLERMLPRYGEPASRLRPVLEACSADRVRAWCADLGQPTFVGSSGRVFPKAFKTSPLLRAWLRRLVEGGVAFHLRHRWKGWDDDGRLRLVGPAGDTSIAPDATVLALGGASWPQLGADGSWVEPLSQAGVEVAPLRPANCAFVANWSPVFAHRFEGHPLKGVALCFGDMRLRGEATVTRVGLEGGGIYALSGALRDAILRDGEATFSVALRPDLPGEEIVRRIAARPRKQSLSTFLRKAFHLSPAAIGLLHEVAAVTNTTVSALSPPQLAALIENAPIKLVGVAPIARAISTAGGVAFGELDDNLMVRRRPGLFVAGEMLDWEAPTGGYLLQACFATGSAAGAGALAWLGDGSAAPSGAGAASVAETTGRMIHL